MPNLTSDRPRRELRRSVRERSRGAAFQCAVALAIATVASSEAQGAPVAASTPLYPGEVFHLGDLRLIASGELRARTRLERLLARPHVYGIGMMAGLQGELLIRDSKATFGQFDPNRSYHVRTLSGGDVAFLIYAQVPEWRTSTLPPEITDFASLERGLPSLARAAGLNPDGPFPFRLSGHASALRWFVVGGVGNGEPDALSSFMRARTLGGLDDTEINGLGFFSTHHRGVFTNPTSNMHVHFSTSARAAVGTFIGHLDDDVRLAPGALLHLPAAGWQASSERVNERHQSAVDQRAEQARLFPACGRSVASSRNTHHGLWP